jgi:hypothetical protein
VVNKARHAARRSSALRSSSTAPSKDAGKDHDVAQQLAITADGTGRTWKLVEYDYRRRAK